MNLLVQTFGKVPECTELSPLSIVLFNANQMTQISTTVHSEALGLTRIKELTNRKHFNPQSGQFFLE